MVKNELGATIKRLRDAQGYTQQQLAKAVGVSHVTISQWEGGITTPKAKYMPNLAKALRVSVNSLMSSDISNIEPGPSVRGKVPLISWIQAGNWLEMELTDYDYTNFYEHTANVGPRAFALRVIGDSMTSANGRSIPEGSIVVADPDISAEHGKVVIARLDESGATTLKQLVVDGDQRYLKPFNDSYKMIPINGNCTIVAVVKQVIQEF